MTPDERKSLAEQILANPLFTKIIDDMERDAIEWLVSANVEDFETRRADVAAIRNMRAALTNSLSVHAPRKAPA